MALVSVVTAARNASAYLPEMAASIQSQTMTDWELIIVDDASDDRTRAVAGDLAAGDERIRVRGLDRNVGSYAAAMAGVEWATGRYLARIDADDTAPPRRLELQVAQLDAGPWRASTGGWRNMDAAGTFTDPPRLVASHSNPVLAWQMCCVNGLAHGTLMLDVELFRELGGYRARPVAEDYHLWSRLTRLGVVGVVDEPLLHARRHPAAVTAAPGASLDPVRVAVYRDHLSAMTGATWSEDDVSTLRGLRPPARWGRQALTAASAIRRFASSWRADDSLTVSERRELRRTERDLVTRHVKQMRGRRRLAPTVRPAGVEQSRP